MNLNFILPDGSRPEISGSRKRRISDQYNNHDLFVDKYKPTSETDLCVPRAKIKQLKEAILRSALYVDNQNAPRILIITGPTGCGKSTAVNLLSETMAFDILEWENPKRYQYDPGDSYRPTIKQFEEFIHFATRMKMLKDPNRPNEADKKKIILLDDIPDLSTGDVFERFQQCLKRTLQSPCQFLIILIINDLPLESIYIPNSSSKRNIRMNNMTDAIPKEFYDNDRVQFIKFNPVTRAKMEKILSKIISAEELFVSTDQLNELIETSNGDIRLAINNLQLEPRNSIRNKKICSLNSSHKNLCSSSPSQQFKNDTQISEAKRFNEYKGTLSLFHAIGKVMHAKRLPDGKHESSPAHILDKLPTSPDQFISHIHQNCPPYFADEDIDTYARCLQYLSVADTIRSSAEWQEPIAAKYRGEVSVRGMMTKHPTITLGRRHNYQAIEAYSVHSLSTEVRKKALYEEWMASVEARITTFADEDKMEEDPIEDFSEDEFDDDFGSGADLLDLL